MRKTFLSVLIIFSCNLFAQEKLTPELLWKLGRITEFDVSADGKTVIYVVKRYDLSANKGKGYLYRIPAGGGEPQLLSNDKQNPSSVKFVRGGQRIAYMSSETGEMQLWEMNADGSAPSPVTTVAGGISGYLYSPDEKKIAWSADVKTQLTVKERYPDLPLTSGRIADELMYRHWDSWEDEYNSHLFIAPYTAGQLITSGKDLMPAETFDAPPQPFGGMEEVSWSRDSKLIAYSSKKLNGTRDAVSTNTDIYVYDTESGKQLNFSETNKGYDKAPSFSPDGKKMAWLSMAKAGYESDKNRLMLKELQDGNTTDITVSFPYSVENFIWMGNRICFSATIQATQQLFLYDPSAKKEKIRQLSSGDHDITGMSLSKNGNKESLVIMKMSISQPAELYTFDLKTAGQKQLSFVNRDMLSKIKMGKVEKRMVRTTDGKQMLTWVILPPDFDANKKYPALLYCQGGPQSPVSQFFSYRWNFQLMAAQGYIVVAPNRRGLPGFGPEWNDAIVGDYGGQCMQDYLSAIDSISKETYVNKERLGAVGASFGGFSVYWLAGNHNKRFRCFIAHCGMFNMESWYGSTEEMFFANNDNRGPYWQEPKPANYLSSPHLFVKNWDTPILIIHNEKDFRVPLTQGMEAFTAAQLKGVPSKFLSFPDENHWMLKPQNSILWQRVFFEWLDQWLKE
jgi:dipeptidyl aminopeptidase/acylaminoacyl peptidase